MAADQGVIDSVSNVNTKAFGDAPSHTVILAMQNAVSHQARLNLIAEGALTRLNLIGEATVATATKKILSISPDEAQADATVSEAGGPGLVTAFLAALASGQQSAKVAQSTPPETAKVA